MKFPRTIFLALLILYGSLYIATTKHIPCEDDCERMLNAQKTISANRPYVEGVSRCTYRQASDTLCVYVRDTTGINWSLFADTACMAASQNGLPHQKIFILKWNSYPMDTLVKKVCP